MTIQEYISSGAIESCLLGVADNEEQLVFQQMKLQHAEVAQYANAFEEKLEVDYLHDSKAVSLDPAIYHNIKKDLGFSAKVVPIAKHASMWKQYAVAASVALLLGSTLFNFMLLGRVKSLQGKVDELAKNTGTVAPNKNAEFAFLSKPSVKSIAMYGVGNHKICNCTIFWDKETNNGYFVIHHLANMGSDYDFQLWGEVDGKMVDLGLLNVPADKSPILLKNLPENAKRFVVTLEKKGGNQTPSSNLFLDGQLAT